MRTVISVVTENTDWHHCEVPMPGTIVIAGGSGLLGRALGEYFVQKGYQVVALTRGVLPPASPGFKGSHWPGEPADVPQPWETALEGSLALINMAGRSVNCRYPPRNRRAMMDSRILSTRAL